MIPTTEKNIGERLFFRYFLIYTAAFVPLLLIVRRGLPIPYPDMAGLFQLIVLALALFGGVTVISGVYLPILCIIKAGADAAFFHRITKMVKTDAIGMLEWNALFLLSALSLFLFLFAASASCRFSFSCRKRDFSLVLSKPFAQFLLQCAICMALSLLLMFLFSRAEEMLPR